MSVFKKSAFTIVELILIIAMLAVMATVGLFVLNPGNIFNRVNNFSTQVAIGNTAQTIEYYLLDNEQRITHSGGQQLPTVTSATVISGGVTLDSLDDVSILENDDGTYAGAIYIGLLSSNQVILAANTPDGLFTQTVPVLVDISVASSSSSSSTSSSSAPPPYCSIDYQLPSQWGSGFVANVVINNTSGSPISGWTIAWTFPGDQQITNAWNVSHSQVGQSVTASDLGWNANIADGGSTNFGFQASYSGSNGVLPSTAFTLNGNPCE